MKPSSNQIASSLFAATISAFNALASAAKVASASTSETFFEIVKPSHHKVAPGKPPGSTDGADESTVFEVTFSEDPSSSRITDPLEPHIIPRAASPASHIACVSLEA